MADDTPDRPDPSLPRWLAELRPGGPRSGFMECGAIHSLIFVKREVNRLVVSFDNLSNVGDRSTGREPWGFGAYRDMGVSHLGVMAHKANWYRNAELIARLTRLRDDGFFEGFERVIFAGASMGGFGALSLGALVPGAHAVVFNPQSTLDPDLVPWETRFQTGRKYDWSLPLSDAAPLTAGFGRVSVFYDPRHALDPRHVDRLSGDNLRLFHCRYSDHKSAMLLRKIHALKPVMRHAVFDELTDAEFYRLYRERRRLTKMRDLLKAYFEDTARPEMALRAATAFRRLKRRRKRAEERRDASKANAVE